MLVVAVPACVTGPCGLTCCLLCLPVCLAGVASPAACCACLCDWSVWPHLLPAPVQVNGRFARNGDPDAKKQQQQGQQKNTWEGGAAGGAAAPAVASAPAPAASAAAPAAAPAASSAAPASSAAAPAPFASAAAPSSTGQLPPRLACPEQGQGLGSELPPATSGHHQKQNCPAAAPGQAVAGSRGAALEASTSGVA